MQTTTNLAQSNWTVLGTIKPGNSHRVHQRVHWHQPPTILMRTSCLCPHAYAGGHFLTMVAPVVRLAGQCFRFHRGIFLRLAPCRSPLKRQPTITNQPQKPDHRLLEAIWFCASAFPAGSGAFGYQWLFNGTNLRGHYFDRRGQWNAGLFRRWRPKHQRQSK